MLPQMRNKTVDTTLFLNSSSYLPAIPRLQSCRERIEIMSLDVKLKLCELIDILEVLSACYCIVYILFT